jgi:hypothetical protein
MDWSFICGLIQIHFCLQILFRLFYRDSIHDIFFKNDIDVRKLLEKIEPERWYGLLNVLKWTLFSKVHIIFIFLRISIFFLFNMHVKELCSWASFHIIFIISLITFNPPLTQWYHSRLQFWHYQMDFLWTIYPPKLVHLTL